MAHRVSAKVDTLSTCPALELRRQACPGYGLTLSFMLEAHDIRLTARRSMDGSYLDVTLFDSGSSYGVPPL